MHQRFRIVVPVGALAAGIVGFLPGCAWEEKLCTPGDVVVNGVEGGRWCEQRRPGDRECPDGQILRRVQATGREDCIPNLVEYNDPERSASTTPS
jgi:hypothetical protein